MKKWGLLFASLIMALSGLFVFAPNTYAAVADGTDPIATGCANDARTVKSDWFGPNGNVLIELRYSAKCRSAWARVTIPQAATDSVWADAAVTRNQDGKQYLCVVPNGSRSCYTPQVNDAGYTSYADSYYWVHDTYYYGSTGSYLTALKEKRLPASR